MGSLQPHRGFTLIELLVVLAIITIVSTVVITSHSTFNKTLILGNTAYDIALTLRTAETYGLGSRVSSGFKNVGYGLHFDSSSPKSFILFADTAGGVPCTASDKPNCKSGDHVYKSTTPADDVTQTQTYELGNGMTVSDFCIKSSGTWSCKVANGLTSLDISFTRPNPDSYISANGSHSLSNSNACITVTSPQGGARFVSVSISGQITANAASDPASCHG